MSRSAPRWAGARRAYFVVLADFSLLLTHLTLWLLPQVRQVPDAVRPSMRKAIAGPRRVSCCS